MKQTASKTLISGISNFPIERMENHQLVPDFNTGTLSALLRKKAEDVNAKELFLLSNAHALNASGKTLRLIPPQVPNQNFLLQQSELIPIGSLTNTSFVGNYFYTYPNNWEQSYFVDAQLTKANLSIEELEILGLSQNQIFYTQDIEAVNQSNLRRGKAYHVRKTGYTTGLTHGKIIETTATILNDQKQVCANVIVIQGWNPKTNRKANFAQQGDSGALIYNQNNKAIGQVWGINPQDTSIAYASHIHPVLAAMGVSLSNLNETA